MEELLAILNASKTDHTSKIVSCESFKDAHVYCVIHRLSGQVTGTLLEKYIIHHTNATKLNSSDCEGDFEKDEKKIELKVSCGGQTHKRFNYVQLRPSHRVDYYMLTAYYITHENVSNCGELFIFKVPKLDMCDLIVKYGTYAHGTIKKQGPITLESVMSIEHVEYALRPVYGSQLWSKLLEYKCTSSDLPNEF